MKNYIGIGCYTVIQRFVNISFKLIACTLLIHSKLMIKWGSVLDAETASVDWFQTDIDIDYWETSHSHAMCASCKISYCWSTRGLGAKFLSNDLGGIKY